MKKANPMKIAMNICEIRGVPVNVGHLTGIIHAIKNNEVAKVGLTKDSTGNRKEYIVFFDGSVIAGSDTLSDILSEDGSQCQQDMFNSIKEMNRIYNN